MKPTLLLLTVLLSYLSAVGQDPEAAAEINVLTYTNSSYHHHDGYQQWIYSPTQSRTGGGFLRTHDIARFHRYGGGYQSNFWANHSFAVGEDPYEYYHEYRNATAWFGPLPADAVWASYSTNYWWWPWMANAETSAYSDGGVHTNYWWSPPESRKALYAEDVPNWTLIFHWGEPHQGYFEKWTNGTTVDTTLELFTGGVTDSTNDVTMQLNVWAYDNLRGRWLTWNEITVTVGTPPSADTSWLRFGPGGTGTLTLTPDSNDNVFLLMQDNQRTQVNFSFHPTNALPTNLPPGAVEDVSFYAWPARHHLLVGVDRNRDGSIELDGTNDLTSAALPYVFWANNDFDEHHQTGVLERWFIGDYWEYDDVESRSQYDFSTPYVGNERDIEDYTLLAVSLPSVVATNGDWTVSLIAPGPVKFLASPVSDFTYLSDPAVSSQIVSNTSLRITNLSAHLTRSGTAHLLMDFAFWMDGKLGFELHHRGLLVGRGHINISIKDIKSMYDRFSAGDADGVAVSPDFRPDPFPQTVAQADGGTLQFFGRENYVLLVHGWNMRIWEKECFAETMFKRLWWQGYRGRCGLFRWQTYTLDHSGGWQIANYDASEFNAWKSALALKRLLETLSLSHPGQVRVLAHSMGNVVTGEALRLCGTNSIVRTYLAMQGAFPAHCYDPNDHFDSESGTATPDRYSHYWNDGALNYIRTKAGISYINMRNQYDFALAKWRTGFGSQKTKPDGSWAYGYNPTTAGISGFYCDWNGRRNLEFPNDVYEIFAFCVQPRCYPIGGTINPLNGAFDSEVNLAAEFGYGDDHPGHSKQFRSTIVQQWALYRRMMEALGFPVR